MLPSCGAENEIFSISINLADFSDSEQESVSLRYISEIIQARTEEIFDLLDKELIKIDRSGLLPAGVVITGGGANLPGITEVAKKRFRLPASLGQPINIHTAVDKVNSLDFTTAIGLVQWGAAAVGPKSKKIFSLPRFKSVEDLTIKLKKWIKSILP